ncbi:MAG: transposase [Terriglobales bacterium]
MPWGLRRFQETGQLHFLTFSCYKRRPNFANVPSRTTFETSLERVRQRYGLCVYGYVVMPEHIHMLVSEPEQGWLSRVMQSLKQSVLGHWPYEEQTRSGRLDTMISTYGASTSLWRSSAIFTAIR